jgi:multidrug transporter EmrE-like cation transporter
MGFRHGALLWRLWQRSRFESHCEPQTQRQSSCKVATEQLQGSDRAAARCRRMPCLNQRSQGSSGGKMPRAAERRVSPPSVPAVCNRIYFYFPIFLDTVFFRFIKLHQAGHQRIFYNAFQFCRVLINLFRRYFFKHLLTAFALLSLFNLVCALHSLPLLILYGIMCGTVQASIAVVHCLCPSVFTKRTHGLRRINRSTYACLSRG